jgi:hypothetical protein
LAWKLAVPQPTVTRRLILVFGVALEVAHRRLVFMKRYVRNAKLNRSTPPDICNSCASNGMKNILLPDVLKISMCKLGSQELPLEHIRALS